MSEQGLEQMLKLVSEDGNNIKNIDKKYLTIKDNFMKIKDVETQAG